MRLEVTEIRDIPGETVKLSIVIPAYNEEARLGPTLEAICAYLASAGRSHEIIVVDDGSQDGTAELVRQWQASHPVIRLIRNEGNRGKGYSVRCGALAARGQVVLFADADNSTPIEQAEQLVARLEEGYDIAIGSRGLPESDLAVRQPVYREQMGKLFGRLMRLLTGLPFRDSQCGFKAFKRDVVQRLFPLLTVDRFAFDTELLFVAVKRFGYRVAEVPVRWVNSPDTRLNALTDSARMLWDLLRVRRQAGKVRAPASSPPCAEPDAAMGPRG